MDLYPDRTIVQTAAQRVASLEIGERRGYKTAFVDIPLSSDSTMPDRPLPLEEIVSCFHRTFRESENTCLVGGFQEPLYVPSEGDGPHEIRFTSDWVRSALHETAHWCIAGRERRKLLDYGYWYCPDGRNEEQQTAFFRVEARPQALEWLFALVAGVPFKISLDNVTGVEIDTTEFQVSVRDELARIAREGPPPRGARFLEALAGGRAVSVEKLWHEHRDDPIW